MEKDGVAAREANSREREVEKIVSFCVNRGPRDCLFPITLFIFLSYHYYLYDQWKRDW